MNGRTIGRVMALVLALTMLVASALPAAAGSKEEDGGGKKSGWTITSEDNGSWD